MTSSIPEVTTRVAHWGWDEHQYQGHAVFEELLGRESLMGLTALSICGRRLSAECCALLDDAAAALTLADPRIWPLKLTRLVASYGGTTAAIAAGLSIQEGAQIGPWTTARASTMLIELRALLEGHSDDRAYVLAALRDYIKDRNFLWGFGTPYRSRDERLVAFTRAMKERGRAALPYFRLLEVVADAVRELRGWEVNMGAGFAAACLDMGLSEQDIGPLATALMQHMFFGNAVEEARQASETLRKLPDEFVTYRGVKARVSPRAAARAPRDP